MDRHTSFITTVDPYTKDELLKNGFQLINEINGVATFVNKGNLNFAKDKKLKIAYTNLLTL